LVGVETGREYREKIKIYPVLFVFTLESIK
jgi:hypothetical protein